ncbi:hypothetical protein LT336_00755 [Spiroplasma sp. JKS002671]|uniref:hypothetical protein n=1 Tax=Spiroplasma attinicola TaxID=2904537 RepID=UPI002022A6B0|nr:hypothetical protein [Spiroplasma sp. JKS002671]MCL8211003.1 hypothetical protein [Spiroplasma sp. JKS002671]
MAITEEDIKLTKVIGYTITLIILILASVTCLITGAFVKPPNATLIGVGSSLLTGVLSLITYIAHKVLETAKKRKDKINLKE